MSDRFCAGVTLVELLVAMVIAALVGGMILDKWGIRVSSILFGSLVTLGAALTTLGASDLITTDSTERILLMAGGRILFGIGTEIVGGIVTCIVAKLFNGYALAWAMQTCTR